MKKTISAVAIGFAITLLATSSQADTVQFDFWGTPNTTSTNTYYNEDVGHTETYYSAGDVYNVTAAAYDYISDVNNLGSFIFDDANIWENNRNGYEKGLGVVGGYVEIDNYNVIEIDLTAAIAAGLSDWKIRFNSIDGSEEALLYGSNTQLTTGSTYFTNDTELLSVSLSDYTSSEANEDWYAITGNHNFLYVIEDMFSDTRSMDDVLVYGLQATNPVPEPATMLLFGTGLAGLVGSRLRRKKKA